MCHHRKPNSLCKRLTELITPAVWAQQAYYRQLGIRARILTLPLAAVLTLIWRQVPSVCELGRMLNRQDLLWAKATKVSRQALAQRFLEFPASVFERVLQDLLPQLKRAWLVSSQYCSLSDRKLGLSHVQKSSRFFRVTSKRTKEC